MSTEYSKVSRCMWADAKFRGLSRPQPNAQSLWQFLLTGQHCTSIPGLFALTVEEMAARLRWPVDATRECFAEIERAGMAKADHAAGLVWLPKAIEHNHPESPNVVVGWGKRWPLLPECPLRDEACEGLREGLREAFHAAFDKAIGEASGKPSEPSPKPSRKPFEKPSTKASPNQKQEQKQEQNDSGGARAREAPGTEPATGLGSLPDDATPPAATEPVRLSTVEHPGAVTGDAAVYALRQGSGGKLNVMGAATLLVRLEELAREAVPRALTLADFDLIGRAHAAGAVFGWCKRSVDLHTLVADDGRHLFVALQEARDWQAKQHPAKGAQVRQQPAVATTSEPPREVLSPEEQRRQWAALQAKLRGNRPTGSES